ncbi:MAG: ATP-binding protein [Opitutaceae bacterium]
MSLRPKKPPLPLFIGLVLLAGLVAGYVNFTRQHSQLMAAVSAAEVWLVLGGPLMVFILLRSQAKLRHVRYNLTAAAEQSRSALIIFGADGVIEYVNQGSCELMGYGRRELMGNNWRDFQLTNTDTPPRLVAELMTALRDGKAWKGEWDKRRPNGKFYPLRATFEPVLQRDGQLVCYVATFDDLSEQHATEAQLRAAQQRADAGEEAKKQFLATMSHEVRTPLNGILGFTSLLRETSLTPDQNEYVETIQLSSEALIQLTDGILDFARMESGKFTLDPQPCAPRECVEDALDMVATKAATKGVELLHWVDDSVPAVILADGNRLRQVLANLLSNAVIFTAQGEVEVRVSAERGPDAVGRELIFTVRDTGIGIAPDQHAQLFKPFTQLDQALTRRHGGTGLGLALCKDIVELMGGQIQLKSALGQGSTFSFTLPVPSQGLVMELRPQLPLDQLSLAIAVPPGSLRTELTRLSKRFGTRLVTTMPESLGGTRGWDVALMDVSPAFAAELAARPQPRAGLPPERIFGLVPLSLPSAQRAALRMHFRLLINKPVHQDALRGMLASLTDASLVPEQHREPINLNVLLIDDDPVNQLLMQKQLASLGCRWTKVDSSQRALQELQRTPYDFVLMDLHMPDVDGVTAIQQIRSGEAGLARKDVWIAALTADARVTLKDQVLAIGANDYLTKPVTMPELRIALGKYASSLLESAERRA